MTVHIRNPDRDEFVTLCGQRTVESVSLWHFVHHVIEFKESCCKYLWAHLCPACVEKARPPEA